MAISGTVPETRFRPEQVKTLIQEISQAAGVPAEDAEILALALVDADSRGVSTHGVSRLNIYIRRIQQGLIDPKARLLVERERGSILVLDGGNGLGQVQAVKALGLLQPKAAENGIAAATIRRSQHFGALSFYCNLVAECGQVLLATTTCEPAMSPTGGCDAFFGTNPIAASFPTGKGFPVKVDLATSKVARGHIITAHKQGQAIPEDWAMDKDGVATTDPSSALAGTVLTMAGSKGYALAFLVEVLSGVLSGSAIGPEIGSMYKDMDRPQDVGHFFALLDIDAFMEVEMFKQRMDSTIDKIKAGRKRPGVNEILVPGERSHRRFEHNQREGFPIGSATVKELEVLCEELGVPYELEPVSPSE